MAISRYFSRINAVFLIKNLLTRLLDNLNSYADNVSERDRIKMTHELLGRIKIVLASPRDSKNIGAVCRAIKNMGMTSLVITDSQSIDIREVEKLSEHAFDVFENAVIYDTLDQAVKEASLVAGITRRRGRFRKYFSIEPDRLAERICETESGEIALVFGNEEYGLTDQELSLCQVAVHIPSSDACPSLNLSHAVQVVVYEIFKAAGKSNTARFSPISGEQLEAVVKEVVGSLANIGFFTQVTDHDMSRFFKDIFGRAMLASDEADRILRIFEKIKGIATGKKMKKNS